LTARKEGASKHTQGEGTHQARIGQQGLSGRHTKTSSIKTNCDLHGHLPIGWQLTHYFILFLFRFTFIYFV